MRTMALILTGLLLIAVGRAGAEEVQIEVFWPEGTTEKDFVSLKLLYSNRATSPTEVTQGDLSKQWVPLGESETVVVKYPARVAAAAIPAGVLFDVRASVNSENPERPARGMRQVADMRTVIEGDSNPSRSVLVFIRGGWVLRIKVLPPLPPDSTTTYWGRMGKDEFVSASAWDASGYLTGGGVSPGTWVFEPSLHGENDVPLPRFTVTIPDCGPGEECELDLLVDASGAEPILSSSRKLEQPIQVVFRPQLDVVLEGGYRIVRDADVEIADLFGETVWEGPLSLVGHSTEGPLLPRGSYIVRGSARHTFFDARFAGVFSLPCEEPVIFEVSTWCLLVPESVLSNIGRVDRITESGALVGCELASAEDGRYVQLPGPGEYDLLLWQNGCRYPRRVKVTVTERFTVLEP